MTVSHPQTTDLRSGTIKARTTIASTTTAGITDSPVNNGSAVACRSGFVGLVGRANAGKSTLLNQVLGQHVSVVSDKAQTTRSQLRGVLTRPDAQIVFVDTPGMQRPRDLLGSYLNAEAADVAHSADLVCLVIDASAQVGGGDSFIASRIPSDSVAVITKSDLVSSKMMLSQLAKAGQFGFDAYFPVSGVTGEGVDVLVEYLVHRMPLGAYLYPAETVVDKSDAFRIAELVREQLLAMAKHELPYSIATQVTEWRWPYIRCEIYVERESQKPIVIGKGGSVLKSVGKSVRRELDDGAYLDLVVKVRKDWRQRAADIRRLGFNLR